jgi:hypothetical protein
MDRIPTPGGGAPPKKGRKLDRRKMMIYGGVGAALLLLLLLSRRNSSGSGSSTTSTSTFPAAESIPTGAGGGSGDSTGYGTGSSLDTTALQSTLDQLPGAITGAVSAGVQSGLAGTSQGAAAQPSGSVPDFLGALGTYGLTISAGGGLAGEQNGPATTAGGGRTAKASPAFTTRVVKNPGTGTTQTQHVYADHTVVVSSVPTLPNNPTGGAHKSPAKKPTASSHTTKHKKK